MWGNILKTGETHSVTYTSNNFLSGVFYLESDGETGIIFSEGLEVSSRCTSELKKENKD